MEKTELSTLKREWYLTDGRLVLDVLPASPAAAVGIKPGWVLLTIDGEAPSEQAISLAMTARQSTYLFVDEPLTTVWTAKQCAWPFGIVTAPYPSDQLRRAIHKGQFDLESVTNFWKYGALSALGGLASDLERCVSNTVVSPLRSMFGPRAKPEKIATSDNYLLLELLALAFAAKGETGRAELYQKGGQVSKERAAQASYSTIGASMVAYTQSLIAEQRGNSAAALEAARIARRFAPDIAEVERRLARLEGRPADMEMPAWTLRRFPTDYDLPANDPVGEITSNVLRVKLSEVIGTLADGEFVVVFVMGPYRSNYYYNEDLCRLAILHRAFPGTIREVHVICGSEDGYALDIAHRRRAEGSAHALGLPFVILVDKAGSVDQALGQLEGYPARFVVDRHGIVRGTERLMDEIGFWMARSRMGLPERV